LNQGIGNEFGIFLIIAYFWDDIKKIIQNTQHHEEHTRENQYDSRYYDRDTARK